MFFNDSLILCSRRFPWSDAQQLEYIHFFRQLFIRSLDLIITNSIIIKFSVVIKATIFSIHLVDKSQRPLHSSQLLHQFIRIHFNRSSSYKYAHLIYIINAFINYKFLLIQPYFVFTLFFKLYSYLSTEETKINLQNILNIFQT